MKNQTIRTIALAAFLSFSGAVAHAQISNGLVVHLTFDGTNASGNYTNTIANGIEGVPVGTPYFTNAPGAIGHGAVSLTTRKDSSICLKKIVTQAGRKWSSKPLVASKRGVTRRDAF